jgi:hypothetical protein
VEEWRSLVVEKFRSVSIKVSKFKSLKEYYIFHQPITRTQNPKPKTQNPKPKTQQPQTTNHKPSTINHQPLTINH